MATVREFVTKWGFKVDKSELEGLEKQMSRIKTLAGSAVKILAGTGLATAGLLKLAGYLEMNEVALTTMLGSAEKAQKMLQDMSDFAAKTPFTLRGVRRSGKMLIGMGIEAEKLIPTMKMLGDVASGTGADFARIAHNFGQVKTRTKLTGQELRDFALNGIPLIKELAKNMGVSEQAVQDMTSDGTIKFAEVEKAFQTMSGEGGQFFDLMIKQSKTLPGLFSNFGDALAILGEKIGMDLLPEAKRLIRLTLDWVQANSKFIKKDVTPFLSGMLEVSIGLFKIMKAIFKVTKALAKPFGGLGKVVKFATVALLAFAAAQALAFGATAAKAGMVAMVGLLTKLGALYVANGARAVAMWAATAAGPLLAVAAIGLLLLALEDIMEWVDGNDKTIMHEIFGPLKDFSFKDLLSGALKSFEEWLEELKQAYARSGMGAIFGPLITAMQTFIKGVKEIIAFATDDDYFDLTDIKKNGGQVLREEFLPSEKEIDDLQLNMRGALEETGADQFVPNAALELFGLDRKPGDERGLVPSNTNNQSSNVNQSNSVTINVDGAQDPEAVGVAVRRELDQTLRQSLEDQRGQIEQ